MVKYGTFYSFRNLSHAVSGCHNSVLLLSVEQKGRHRTTVEQSALTSQLACTCHQRPEGKW